MAGASAKKIQQSNKFLLKFHFYSYGLVVAFYVFYQLYYNAFLTTKSTYLWFTSILLINTFILYQFISHSKSNRDLGQSGGLISFFVDVKYTGWFCLVMSTWSSWFCWIYVGAVGLFAVIKLKAIYVIDIVTLRIRCLGHHLERKWNDKNY
jgi:SRP-independent targeting protein 2/TMEM208